MRSMEYLNRKIRICRANNIKKLKNMKTKNKSRVIVNRIVRYSDNEGNNYLVEVPIKSNRER